LNSGTISKRRIGDSSDIDGAAPFPSILEDTVVFLSTFPDFPEPLDANSGQRRALLDTGQRLHLGNSGTKRVHPQHSALGAADNPEAAEPADHSALDDSDASDSSRVTSGEPERGTDPNSILDDSTGSSERSASGSADNPSATESTAHHRFTDERSARGDGDAGRWSSSEAEARVPSSQLGGEPSVCGA
jgi:hypothetical protein